MPRPCRISPAASGLSRGQVGWRRTKSANQAKHRRGLALSCVGGGRNPECGRGIGGASRLHVQGLLADPNTLLGNAARQIRTPRPPWGLTPEPAYRAEVVAGAEKDPVVDNQRPVDNQEPAGQTRATACQTLRLGPPMRLFSPRNDVSLEPAH